MEGRVPAHGGILADVVAHVGGGGREGRAEVLGVRNPSVLYGADDAATESLVRSVNIQCDYMYELSSMLPDCVREGSVVPWAYARKVRVSCVDAETKTQRI